MKAPRKSEALVGPQVSLTPEQAQKVLAAIAERSVEEGDCLLWTGGCSRGSGSRRPQPALWLDGQVRPLRRLAYVAYGKELHFHWRVSTTCGNDECLSEHHLKRKSHSESLKGHTKSPITRARIAAAKQAASRLDWATVREIRASDRSDEDWAAEIGCHPDTVQKARTHQTWIERGFFSGLIAQEGRP